MDQQYAATWASTGSGHAGPPRASGRQRGFSLIELMIVIVVLSILTVAAVAMYGSSTVKARRGSAEACLMEAAQFMERHYTFAMTYAGGAPAPGCAAELADHYTFGFSEAPDADSYKLEAVPKGTQLSRDTQCGTLGLDNFGTKTVTGTAGPEDCW